MFRPIHFMPRRACAALFAGLLACGCSAGQADSAPDAAPSTFVAFVPDFAGFRTWPSTPGVGPDGAPQPPSGDGGIHSGPLTTYINRPPPSGSTSFPVGTIIVKEPTTPPLSQRAIFAMVKRGGGFNLNGATDWEWFELQSVDETNVAIVWRGAVPPAGESYGAVSSICNDCHTMARSNDFVWTAGLALSSF